MLLTEAAEAAEEHLVHKKDKHLRRALSNKDGGLNFL